MGAQRGSGGLRDARAARHQPRERPLRPEARDARGRAQRVAAPPACLRVPDAVEFTFTVTVAAQLWRARSRLHRSQIFQVNTPLISRRYVGILDLSEIKLNIEMF